MLIEHPMDPVYDADARVLILGSMPGEASLTARQYYAHPKNQFWDIMGALVGAGRNLEYEERLEALKQAGIALWDVIASCERTGSLDAAIRSETVVPNAILAICSRCPNLKTLCFNGKAAERYYNQYVYNDNPQAFEKFQVHSLPSTSPAYAAMTLDEKLKQWRKILPMLKK